MATLEERLAALPDMSSAELRDLWVKLTGTLASHQPEADAPRDVSIVRSAVAILAPRPRPPM